MIKTDTALLGILLFIMWILWVAIFGAWAHRFDTTLDCIAGIDTACQDVEARQ